MTQTVFTAYAGVDSNVTSTGSSSAYRLPKTQGDTIPVGAVIQSATLLIGSTYQYSAMRLFAAYLDGTRAHSPRSTSGNSGSGGNVAEQLYIVLDNTNLYGGKNEISMVLRGEGRGSASNDGNVLKINASGTIALTVNWSPPTVTTPGAFTAKPLVYEAGDIDLAWGASTSSGGGIKHYEVQQKIGSGNWTALKTVTGTTTKTSLSDIARGTWIKYRVRAIDNLNTASGWKESNEIRRNSAPTAPKTITASPSLFESGDITVKIAAATDIDGSVARYDLWRKVTINGVWQDWEKLTTNADTTYTDRPSVGRGEGVQYVVSAVDNQGAYSDWAFSNTIWRNSAPNAPKTVTVTPSPYESGNLTIKSDGATDPNNNITRYGVRRNIRRNGAWLGWVALTTSAGATYTDNPNIGRGEEVQYGTMAYDAFGIGSGWTNSNIVKRNSAPTAPTSVTVTPTEYESGNLTIKIAGATDPDNNISRYIITRRIQKNGVWSDWVELTGWGGTIFTNNPYMERGDRAQYAARTVDVFGVMSDWTYSQHVKRNEIPPAPAISVLGGGTIYNVRPRILVQLGIDPEWQLQTIVADGYTPSSAGPYGNGKKLVLRKNSNATQGNQSVAVAAKDALGALSVPASVSYSYGVAKWSDHPVKAKKTRPKAAHITEIRAAIDTVRKYYMMSQFSWAEEIIPLRTSLNGWKNHVAELWEAINEIAAYINSWDASTVTNGIVLPARVAIKNWPTAAAINQLRDIISIL